MEKFCKDSFAVIGIAGSTADGEGFVSELWRRANDRFAEIEPLALRCADGTLAGIWGAMSDFSLSFAPWQGDFSSGLYLAGAECRKDASPPPGWTRWQIPAFEFVRFKNEGADSFRRALCALQAAGLHLAGAAQDYHDLRSGLDYICLPIRRL